MRTRNELLTVLVERYRRSERDAKRRILDEFVAVSGYHRKHAARLLRSTAPLKAPRSNQYRIYGEAVRAALIVLWEASDRVCGKRLRPLIPLLLEAMERHGHLDLAPEVRAGLVTMSAATIDRALREAKAGTRGPHRRGTGSTALRRSIPIRTFSDWYSAAIWMRRWRQSG